MKSARTKLASPGGYKADDYVSDSLELWVDAWDSWTGLFPFAGVDPTPILFTTLGASAPMYVGFVSISALPSGATLKNAGLTALEGSGTGTVATAIQPDGTLKLSVTGLASLAVGDLYESICYYTDASGDHLVAVLRMNVV